jgi:hypothetical protein
VNPATPGQDRREVVAVPAWVIAAAVGGTVLIALGAFWLSFVALTDLAQQAGIPAGQAWVWPLIVDGLIVVSTVAVVVLTPYGRRAIAYPWTLLLTGAAVSVWGNASHAVLAADTQLPSSLAAVISAVPPLVLLAITHLTVELTRRTRPGSRGRPRRDPSHRPIPRTRNSSSTPRTTSIGRTSRGPVT